MEDQEKLMKKTKEKKKSLLDNKMKERKKRNMKDKLKH